MWCASILSSCGCVVGFVCGTLSDRLLFPYFSLRGCNYFHWHSKFDVILIWDSYSHKPHRVLLVLQEFVFCCVRCYQLELASWVVSGTKIHTCPLLLCLFSKDLAISVARCVSVSPTDCCVYLPSLPISPNSPFPPSPYALTSQILCWREGCIFGSVSEEMIPKDCPSPTSFLSPSKVVMIILPIISGAWLALLGVLSFLPEPGL